MPFVPLWQRPKSLIEDDLRWQGDIYWRHDLTLRNLVLCGQ